MQYHVEWAIGDELYTAWEEEHNVPMSAQEAYWFS